MVSIRYDLTGISKNRHCKLTCNVVKSENSPDSDSTKMLPSIDPTGLVQGTILLSFVFSFSTRMEVGLDKLIPPVVMEGFLFWLIVEVLEDV